MKNLTTISDLRNKGFRITPIRSALLEILFVNKKPMSISNFTFALHKKDLSANKSTLYRELDFLKSQNLITEVEFGDGKKRYEINSGKHHHHIVCVNCGRVEDVELKVDLSLDEKKVEKQTGFKISEHSIELFGLCSSCQNK